MPASFAPPLWLRHAHAQTVWANWAPRPAACAELAAASIAEEVRVLDDRLRVHWTHVDDAAAPIVVILHGLTGCAASPMVLGVGAKAHARGFRVCRVDLRNSSADIPSRQIGHAGRSEDLHAVIAHVVARWPDAPIGVVGYSLGGNVACKAVGEYADRAPAALRALAGISVPIDLDRSCAAIDALTNFHYRWYFLTRLRATVARRAANAPELYGDVRAPSSWSIRDFDDAVVAPLGGFQDATDYYTRSSCLARLPDIRVPSLLLHAADDPFVPGAMYRDARVRDAESVDVLTTRRGGHVGFWSRPGASGDSDPFWAEHRAMEFIAARLTA